MARPFRFVLVSLALCWVAQASYRAGVVEFVPPYLPDGSIYSRTDAAALMLKNLAVAEIFVKKLADSGAEIVVLPEDGLYGSTFTRETLTPFLEALPATGTTDNTYVPCDDSNAEKETPVFHQLSCIAKKYKVDLIANMGDIEPCGCLEETCPPNGHYQYNTNVALWRNGSYAGKYHKHHLFHEDQFDSGEKDPLFIFESSFGVRMGLMVCFDILFSTPWAEYLAAGVRDIAIPMWWVNSPPLMTATQVQAGFAADVGANLIAAGIGGNLRFSGSGMYGGKCSKSLDSQSTSLFYFNPTDQPGIVALAATLPSSPSDCASLSLSPVTWAPYLDSVRPSDLPPLSPWPTGEFPENDPNFDVALTPFDSAALPPLETTYTAATSNISCSVSVLKKQDSSPDVMVDAEGSNSTYVVMAASGNFNGLFPASYCGVLRCPVVSAECFQQEGVQTGHAVFESISVTLSMKEAEWKTWKSIPMASLNISSTLTGHCLTGSSSASGDTKITFTPSCLDGPLVDAYFFSRSIDLEKPLSPIHN